MRERGRRGRKEECVSIAGIAREREGGTEKKRKSEKINASQMGKRIELTQS